MSDNDQSLYTLRYNQVTGKIEGQGGTPSWNALALNQGTFTPGNVRYVDGRNGSDSDSGAPGSPLKTISAACVSIGSATTSDEYNDAATSSCLIVVAPGTYTENVALPQRQIVCLQLQDALIIGNVSQTVNGLIITGPNDQHKVTIIGNDQRSVYTGAGIPLTGIDGNLSSIVNHPAGQAIFQLFGVGITGDIVVSSSVGNYTLQLFVSQSMYLGDIITNSLNTVTLYAANCNTSTAKALGGVNGAVILYVLNDVVFTRPVVATGSSGGQWFNVRFLSGAHNFTGYGGTVRADANSYASFQANVPAKGTFSFVLVDNATGVAYTPTTPSDWVSVPATVQQALDTLPTMASSIAEMPRTNLAAEYLMDEGIGTRVRNSVSPNYPSNNLIGPSEQFFAAWGGAATDIGSENPYGDYTASRFLAAGGSNAYLSQANYPYISGQQYTLSIWVKSNTGLAQKIRMSDDQANFTGDIDVTTAWTRVSSTFTASGTGYVIPVAVDAALDATDVLIWGVQLEIGPNPTTYVQQSLQMTFGVGPQSVTSGPSWIPQGLDFTANGGAASCLGLSQLPLDLFTTTVYAVMRQTTAPYLAGYAPIVSDEYAASLFYVALIGSPAPLTPRFKFNGGLANASLVNVGDGSWYLLTARYDGTSMDIFVNGSKVCSIVAAIKPIQIHKLFLSNFNYSAFFPGSLGYASIYSVAHTDAQIAENVTTIETLMAARGATISPLTKFAAFEGDSITALGSYSYLALAALPTFIQGTSQAVSGSGIATMVARAAETDSYYDSTRSLNILSVLIGANDLVSLGAVTWVADLKSYCLARRAVGWKILLLTVLPQTTVDFNAVRNTANGLVRSDPSFYDALADIASDPTIGQDADAADTTYYSDGVHPTAAANAIMAPYVTAAIETL